MYVTVPATVALVQLRLPRPGWRALAPVTCLALAAYLVVSNDAYLERQWGQTTEARAWLDAVRDDVGEWSDPAVTLVPLMAPAAMATGWSRPFARQDRLLDLVRKGFTPGDLGPRPVLIDDGGRVRPAALVPARVRTRVDTGGCTPSGSRARERDPLSAEPSVVGGPLFLRLSYEADRDTEAQLSAGWRTRWTLDALPTHLDAGTHTQLLAIDATRLDRVDLRALTPGAGFCVRDASIVRPVLVDGRNRCRAVDQYGRAGDVVPCPAPPER